MHLIFLVVVSLGMLTWAAMDFHESTGQANTAEVRAMDGANQELAAYQTFLMTAEAVMLHTPFAGAAVQTRTWPQIRDHAHAPTFVRQVEMPTTWRVRGNDTGWVVCAPMSEHATRLLSGYVPASMGPNRLASVQVSGNLFVIMGEQDAARHAVYAAWCAS